jgi:hypothetical protein
MAFMVYSKTRKRILFRSNIRSACDPTKPNHRLLVDREIVIVEGSKPPLDKVFIQSKSDDMDTAQEHRLRSMPGYTPHDLINRSFLDIPCEDGHRFRLRIVKAIADHIELLDKQPEKVKLLVEAKEGGYEKILGYNEILSFLNDENIATEDVSKLKDITAHQGPLTQNDPNYKGSQYNVLIECEDGDITYEPLDVISADDPVTCALYAKKNNLLHLPGWTRFKQIAKDNNDILSKIYTTIHSYHYKKNE